MSESEIGVLSRQAVAAHEAGALPAADAILRRILELDPTNEDAIRRRVAIAQQRGRSEDALAVVDAAIRADPINPDWAIGRALVLGVLGRRAEAIPAYDQAIALRPLDDVYQHDRAITLLTINRFPEALAGFNAAIAIRPDSARNHTARGGALWRLGRFEEALAGYDRAIELQEDFAHAWFAKALLLLLMGRYKEGWELHEWRNWLPQSTSGQRLFRQPMWEGAGFHGQMMLLHAEQGLGDTIQFYRFVNVARNLGGVIVEVAEPLARLLASQPNAPLVLGPGQLLPDFALQCPIMSLPWVLGTELHTIPTSIAYLEADAALAASWASRLPPKRPGQLRVGISWTGNTTLAVNHTRSMPLATMLSMFGPDVALVSLQKDVPASDQTKLAEASQVTDLGGSFADLADTAAVISQLDLVVSVCTSVAHVAGALGKPVWIMLAADADWRWLTDREDSPWYPSARLFRQETPGDWDGVAARVREALARLPVPR